MVARTSAARASPNSAVCGGNALRLVEDASLFPFADSGRRRVRYRGIGYRRSLPTTPPTVPGRFCQIPMTTVPSSSGSYRRGTPIPSPNGIVAFSSRRTRCPPARVCATISGMCAHCFSAYDDANRGTSKDSKSFPNESKAPSVHEIFPLPPFAFAGSQLTPTVAFFTRAAAASRLFCDSIASLASERIISALRLTRASTAAGSSGGARARFARRAVSARRRASASVGTKPCLKSVAVAELVLSLCVAVPACTARRFWITRTASSGVESRSLASTRRAPSSEKRSP
mmetsp:Transcript_8524/g.36111  ORF Transcript_8524/g.36111 Transcript_8524/m.36111 type:complete len:286 (-) Transcript_8524:484-1341(-)